jgi:hypothetical protein
MEEYHIEKIENGLYNVKKDEVSDYVIHVDSDKSTCSCPHFRYKKPEKCKHIDFVIKSVKVKKMKGCEKKRFVDMFLVDIEKRKRKVRNMLYMIEEDCNIFEKMIKK